METEIGIDDTSSWFTFLCPGSITTGRQEMLTRAAPSFPRSAVVPTVSGAVSKLKEIRATTDLFPA
jgi:hypothetical protein